MTMFERLERLEQRIGVLEAEHAAQSPRLAASTDDGLKPLKEDPFVARLLEVNTPRYVRDPEFREACDLLKNWLWQHMYGGRTPDAETDAFLARARVATEEP